VVERNRLRLIDAAQRAFTEQGEQVALERIAEQAGSGSARCIATSQPGAALVEAVYRSELTRLQQSAGALPRQQPPAQALRAWMDRFADYVATKRGMARHPAGVGRRGHDHALADPRRIGGRDRPDARPADGRAARAGMSAGRSSLRQEPRPD
jgi:hypothetical protein